MGSPNAPRSTLAKSRTGIAGLDELTYGGIPAGRPTLVCGRAGCGKTLMALEFLVRGATEFDEPGVFVAFEETGEELTANVKSLGFDLAKLIKQKKLAVDHVYVERSEIEETGEYDLEGLFIRLQYASDSVGAKRVVLDTLEALFASLPNEGILRAELRRLFRWLKERGMTAVITAERGEGSLTRHGLEEYVADCVILLDHRVDDQISTRRLRVVKYRGSAHGTNEYPFLITESGISVLPITSLGLDHGTVTERISTGVAGLDEMLGGKGVYRGSSVLVSGTAGTGKSSLAGHFVEAECRRGGPVLYFAFEESPQQILRNMKSIGLDLEPWVRKKRFEIHASRPTLHGLELHLLLAYEAIKKFKPQLVVFDPVTSLSPAGDLNEIKAMLLRIIDFLKCERITGLYLSLTMGGEEIEQSQVGVSSLMDTWFLVRNLEENGQRNRTLNVMKSRGMAHSNKVRPFLITNNGVQLVERDPDTDRDGAVSATAAAGPRSAPAKPGSDRRRAAARARRSRNGKSRKASRKST